MRVFVAGGTGALGRRLMPLLLAAGHEVVGLTRVHDHAEWLRFVGATAVLGDALDRTAVVKAVVRAEPEAVVHELTAFSKLGTNLRRFERDVAETNQLRTAGTDILRDAAVAAGARRLVAQSFAGWTYARAGGAVKTEEDPLEPDPLPPMRGALDAIRYLERAVLDAPELEGIVLRYGTFYGPGTSFSGDGLYVAEIRRRRFPIVGDGEAVWSFVHVDDAARATVAAIDGDATGVYNIVDDEPAPVAAWLPELAAAVGAKPPRHVPVWLGRLVAGELAVFVMTDLRAARMPRRNGSSGGAPSIRAGGMASGTAWASSKVNGRRLRAETRVVWSENSASKWT
ncbi:MAG TPA: NAD(P)-dependent oxidoreductase [Gaiellaceae bacterium]|nr:NAD(P)-dependent oxidoreductase [Gaiellaceae bacterium]